MESKVKKTFKRETAWAFLGIIAYVVFQENVELLEVLVWPFMLFIGTAYGMDWASKQTDLTRNRSQ